VGRRSDSECAGRPHPLAQRADLGPGRADVQSVYASVGATFTKLGRCADARHLQTPRLFSSQPSVCCPPLDGVSVGRVTKIAIDKRAREGDNKGHEESLAGVLPASGRLHGEEAAGCSDSASDTEPVATAYCRTHRTLCSRKTGKCQHSDLQLSACDHCDRFKNGAHQASLQENERGKMRLALEGAYHRAQAAPS
jgi:hypothetical protein